MSYAHSMTMMQINDTATVYHRNQVSITVIEPNAGEV